MIGQTIGNYRVTAKLGAGGMGEVFRATDVRLGREVALKFSAEQFSERFEREARAVAALNHPNICTLHDVAPNYLVMELVEGMTLAERIVEGPLPLDEALAVARQIAAALEEAHEKGITHRDLKPSNIKIKPDGTVKVLDFGLAKFVDEAARVTPATQAGSGERDRAQALTMSPTITSPAAMTYAGVILGTAAYMSPEQAKGKPVDRRADIWAFGVVLYEMLTGKRPFRGDDVGDVLASVIKEEPNWNELPGQVRRLVQRCLEKDARKRLRDISGVELLLEREMRVEPVNRPRLPPVARWLLAGALATGMAFAIWQRWPDEAVDRLLVRLDVNLGPDVSLGSLRGADVIISPDATRLVFVSQGRLWTRRLDEAQAAPLGSETAFAPFFSPDGQSVGFFGGGKLKRIPITGGAPTTLADATGFGGSWGTDGYIVASLDGRVLSRIPEGGGPPMTLTEVTDDEIGHRWPQVLPGGQAILFTSQRNGDDQINVLSLADRRKKVLQKNGRFGRHVAGPDGAGYLVFENAGTLYGVRFDTQRLEVQGTPAPVIEGVGSSQAGAGSSLFDASPNGTFVYRTSGQNQFVGLHWIDARGNEESLPIKPGAYQHPRLSPDGERIALTITSPTSQDIGVYDVRRKVLLPLTFGGGSYQFPVWTTDGRYIVFSRGTALGGMSWTRADGASQPQVLTQSKNGQFPWSFSPDGERLAFADFAQGSGDIWTVPVDIDSGGLKAGKPEPFLRTSANELYPAFSPDGRWIAYRSFETGASEIYVRAFPDTGGKWPVSMGGGVIPIWSPVGSELFYRTEGQQIMRVPYRQNAEAFSPDPPRPWMKVSLANITQRNLDISPDGTRFVALLPANQPEAEAQRNHVVFLQNFGDELRRRVGTGK